MLTFPKLMLVPAVVVAVLTAGAVAVPAQADAASYQARAVKKANQWAYYSMPSAYYIETECYPAGYLRADCQIYVTKARSACSVSVTVTGRNYRVRKYDSVC